MTTQLSLLDRDWCNLSAPVVLSAMRGKRFTADDLHGVLDAPENVNQWGVLAAIMVSTKKIKRVGAQKSERPEANGRWIGIYAVVED